MKKIHTEYPIILVHGIILKDRWLYKSFGKTEKLMRYNGYRVYTAPTDGFGTVENNAEQLKQFVLKILERENAQKVNLIAHSKGGLDCRYAIKQLGLEDKVASLTTLSSPHRGSSVAEYILGYPMPILKFIAFFINLWYRIFGDKHPDCLTVCKQLVPHSDDRREPFSNSVYCQSYSATLTKRSFIMWVPRLVLKKMGDSENDGLVTVNSSVFENYKGDCLTGSVSHAEIAGCVVNKRKRKRVLKFYLQVAEDLADRGY